MPTNPMVTLDTDGFLTDPAKIAARLLNLFFWSDESQSNLFRGAISSLPGIISRSPNNIQAIKDGIETALNRLFSAHFDEVNIVINHDIINKADGTPSAQVNISVGISFRHNGELKQVARILEIVDKTFKVREE